MPKKQNKKVAGRPAHEPTKETRMTIMALACCGVPQVVISDYMGLTPKTLRLHYRKELDFGLVDRNAKAAKTMFKLMDSKHEMTAFNAAKFWLSTQAGFKETQRQELTGADGGPIDTKTTINVNFVEPKKDDERS